LLGTLYYPKVPKIDLVKGHCSTAKEELNRRAGRREAEREEAERRRAKGREAEGEVGSFVIDEGFLKKRCNILCSCQ
jgi:hypothetical protein